MKMFHYFIYFCTLVLSAQATGKFTVLTQPPNAVFKGHDHLEESLLPEVYSAVLGFTIEQDSNWQGLYLLSPFDLAKAIVTIDVDGVRDIGLLKGHSYSMKTNQDENEVYDEIAERIEERIPSSEGNLHRFDLKDGLETVQGIPPFDKIKKIKVAKTKINSLKLSVEEDRLFLEEVKLLDEIVDKISAIEVTDDIPTVYWFKVSALHAIVDLHGENSTATKEAKQLLIEAIEELNAAFDRKYDGRVLVNVITSDASHTRRVRRDTENKPKETVEEDLHVSKNYSFDYPVIFNIIFWFGVIMIFTLLAIALFIANMDPGRDSIIYRMTSTRMKKDN